MFCQLWRKIWRKKSLLLQNEKNGCVKAFVTTLRNYRLYCIRILSVFTPEKNRHTVWKLQNLAKIREIIYLIQFIKLSAVFTKYFSIEEYISRFSTLWIILLRHSLHKVDIWYIFLQCQWYDLFYLNRPYSQKMALK